MRLIVIVFLFFSVAAWGQSMLATIDEDVTTEFGTYRPNLTQVEPDAPTLSLESWDDIINADQFDFSQAQRRRLLQNYFLVTPAVQLEEDIVYNEMFDLYNEAREHHIPIFVTTDALLHSFHLCFDYILRTCEEQRFFGQLNALIQVLYQRTLKQYNDAEDSMIRDAAFRNLDYLLVASNLLEPKQYLNNPLPGGNWTREIALIHDASEPMYSSPIFGYEEDYTQYKPRGHYTRSDSLKQFFRSMMWLGRMTFTCADTNATSQSMTLSAILLTQAISDVKVNDRPAMDVWQDIYQPTVFFVGKSDDINFLAYLPLCYNIYGKSFPIYDPDTFADRDKLLIFLKRAQDFKGAAITYGSQPSKGFRFMGQRFIPDSWILDELVYSKIPKRYMPTGLDVMIVLGPQEQAQDEWPFQYLSESDRGNPVYVNKLDSLKAVFRDYPAETWAQNLYWNWLYCFMPLLMPKGPGYPEFMQTDAWRDKDLYAALASWAELRHDTILYAKQSGTEVSVPPTASMNQGYVEPNPHAFGRLAALAEYMMTGLEHRNLLFPEFQQSLDMFASLAASLKVMAEKELTGQPLTLSEYRTIFNIGFKLYSIATLKVVAGGPKPWDDLEPMPVIADVHTDFISNHILEEAVGYPYALYVICNIEGQAVLTRGAGFSYYEFTRPLSDGRLTDEEWREMLQTGEHPDSPSWSEHFIVGDDVDRTGSYISVNKLGTAFLQVCLNQDTLTDADTLEIRIDSGNILKSDSLTLTLEFPDGSHTLLPVHFDSTYRQWQGKYPLSGFAPGRYYLNAGVPSLPDLTYRTHFTVTTTSHVKNMTSIADKLHLYPNYPNPFNPSTLIRFSMQRAGHVQVKVYDINGRQVSTLFSDQLAAGEHRMTWNGKTRDERPAAAGLYLCQIKVRTIDGQNIKTVGKMLLVR